MAVGYISGDPEGSRLVHGGHLFPDLSHTWVTALQYAHQRSLPVQIQAVSKDQLRS